MRRGILEFKIEKNVSGCCPGHDKYPDDVYRNRKSKKARARGKTKEHKYVRFLSKIALRKVVEFEF